jgi:molybdenum cofactor cytidylyltransferase
MKIKSGMLSCIPETLSMRIIDAIRLKKNDRLALVGSGGKTTAMFRLARQYDASVLLTTTTHLAVEEGELADVHFALGPHDSLPDLKAAFGSCRVVLVTGLAHADGRLGSVTDKVLSGLKQFADQAGMPLLIEADGSRKLPIKAPATNEPVIPEWTTAVAVSVGLSCLGLPANDTSVHRFPVFAQITGVEENQPLTQQVLENMFVHPDGGLKGIPRGARRIALLNQADDAERLAQAISLAKHLVGVYDMALVTSFHQASGQDDTLYCAERTAGIILAAGGATRFGQPKSLLEWNGESFIRHVAKTSLAAGLEPLVVVLGATVQPIRESLKGLEVQFVENQNWESGQSSSLRVGMQNILPTNCGGCIILQADQPRVPVGLIEAEIDLHSRNKLYNIVPRVDSHPSSPVLFDRKYFTALMEIEGDQGGRAILARYPLKWLAWNRSEDLLDIDTPEDYQKFLKIGE